MAFVCDECGWLGRQHAEDNDCLECDMERCFECADIDPKRCALCRDDDEEPEQKKAPSP